MAIVLASMGAGWCLSLVTRPDERVVTAHHKGHAQEARAGLAALASETRLKALWTGLRAASPVRFHVLQAGDTLSGLSRRYLGDAEAFPRLQALNPALKPVALPVGGILRLPSAVTPEWPADAWFSTQAGRLETLAGPGWQILSPDKAPLQPDSLTRRVLYFTRADRTDPVASLDLKMPYEIRPFPQGVATP